MDVRPANELTCKQIVELVTAYLDNALSRDERARFDAHLAGCEHCTEYLRQMRLTIEAVGRLPADSLSGETLSELQRAFRSFNRPNES